ncbi:hypothetical protein [Pasteuria penetrans]|uniref:hypothetical protein n=1 Tax=Pasteuria penetrans TaxID=86005 RepID=UPI000F9EBA02|nr:hypothetical protein [Pasteuria penetrans]
MSKGIRVSRFVFFHASWFFVFHVLIFSHTLWYFEGYIKGLLHSYDGKDPFFVFTLASILIPCLAFPMVSLYIAPLKGGHSREELLKWSVYKRKCFQEARGRGISAWRWYGVPGLGFFVFLFSILLFRWGGWHSIWVLTIGIVVWMLSFLWQVWRERRWCEQATKRVDIAFIRRRVLQFLFLYLVPLHVFHYVSIFIDESPLLVVHVYGGIMLLVFVVFFSIWILPVWFFLLFGQRFSKEKFKFWTTPIPLSFCTQRSTLGRASESMFSFVFHSILFTFIFINIVKLNISNLPSVLVISFQSPLSHLLQVLLNVIILPIPIMLAGYSRFSKEGDQFPNESASLCSGKETRMVENDKGFFSCGGRGWKTKEWCFLLFYVWFICFLLFTSIALIKFIVFKI